MKRIPILLPLLLLLLAAQTRMLSPVPLPKNYLVDLDPLPYDETMLREALQNGEIFTFLAKSEHVADEELKRTRQTYTTLFHMYARPSADEYRLAFLLPVKKIGKYASSTTKSALAYLAQRGRPFSLDVVSMADEEEDTLRRALERLEGYHLVIAPLTPHGASTLCDLEFSTRVFVPTLHESRVSCQNGLVSFGGIDYEQQIKTLSYLVEENATNYAVTDGSSLSTLLTDMVKKYVDVEDTIVLGKNGYYKNVIERYSDLNDSTMFLNTPVVKSSLFLSQMTLADFKPRLILSTQLNYTPRLLTLTQYHDRENMVVANSIGDPDPFLAENVALIGQDLRFNWINYATVTGLDHSFAQSMGAERLTRETFEGASLKYAVRIYDAGLYRFIPKELPVPKIETEEFFEEEETTEDVPVYAPFQDSMSD